MRLMLGDRLAVDSEDLDRGYRGIHIYARIRKRHGMGSHETRHCRLVVGHVRPFACWGNHRWCGVRRIRSSAADGLISEEGRNEALSRTAAALLRWPSSDLVSQS